jgi:hypothetical protein
MDPLSITVSVTTLVSICARVISVCHTVAGKYNDATRILTGLRAECAVTRESLSLILLHTTEPDSLANALLASNASLAETFDIALTGCTVTLSVLENELQNIQKENDPLLDFKGKARFIWNESTLKRVMEELRGQRDALNTLIIIVQR